MREKLQVVSARPRQDAADDAAGAAGDGCVLPSALLQVYLQPIFTRHHRHHHWRLLRFVSFAFLKFIAILDLYASNIYSRIIHITRIS